MSAVDLDSLDDHGFRLEIRKFVEANYPDEWRFSAVRLGWRETLSWHKDLYKQGWAAPNWPKELGGMGLSSYRQVIFQDELVRYGVSRTPDSGINMLGPLLIRYGTTAQKDYFLPRTLAGDIIWAQGYSEPGAGSDLASLRTEAVLDGEDYVINGQKIWTTFAHEADWLFVLVRTSKEGKPQEGISFILVDKNTPGITVRPIINLTMEHEFNEVFFDDVRVPKKNLVGEPNKGWGMAKSLLGFERLMLGSPLMASDPLLRLRLLATARGAFSDPVFAEKYAKLRLDVADLSATYNRFIEVVRRGGELGPDASILKLWVSETFQGITELMLEVAGEDGASADGIHVDAFNLHVANLFFVARPRTIAGGTSEVQRNVIAKQVLKLPS